MTKIAREDEILEYLTRLMRGETGNERDGLKAAELIGKRYAMFEKHEDNDKELTVRIDYGDDNGEGEQSF